MFLYKGGLCRGVVLYTNCSFGTRVPGHYIAVDLYSEVVVNGGSTVLWDGYMPVPVYDSNTCIGSTKNAASLPLGTLNFIVSLNCSTYMSHALQLPWLQSHDLVVCESESLQLFPPHSPRYTSGFIAWGKILILLMSETRSCDTHMMYAKAVSKGVLPRPHSSQPLCVRTGTVVAVPGQWGAAQRYLIE